MGNSDTIDGAVIRTREPFALVESRDYLTFEQGYKHGHTELLPEIEWKISGSLERENSSLKSGMILSPWETELLKGTW